MALPSPWLYVATAEARDSDMAERVAVHQARRGPSWTTVETPRDIAGALAANANTPALVDCLTLWLSNVLLADADVDAEIEHLDGALARAGAPIVLDPTLLRAFELDKECREFIYAATYLPSWLWAPTEGLRGLFDGPEQGGPDGR